MRALSLSAFALAAVAVAGCRADYPPQAASIPSDAAPPSATAAEPLAPLAAPADQPAEANGPPINILKAPD